MDAKKFEFASPDIDKLLKYGFLREGESLVYRTNIMNGEMELKVTVKEGEVTTLMTDVLTGDEYTLHLVDEASGSYVGEVRRAYDEALSDILKNCFVKDSFKSASAHHPIEFARQKYGDELEFLWEKFPNDAVLRRKDTKKWYAVLIVIEPKKLGLEGDAPLDIAVVRKGATEREGKGYLPAYHMNKKNWMTLLLDGTLCDEEIDEAIISSYDMAVK